MELTEDVKQMIDGMSYGTLLSRWRFAPVGDPIFQGASGDYFAKVIADRRSNLPEGAHAQISKSLSWRE